MIEFCIIVANLALICKAISRLIWECNRQRIKTDSMQPIVSIRTDQWRELQREDKDAIISPVCWRCSYFWMLWWSGGTWKNVQSITYSWFDDYVWGEKGMQNECISSQESAFNQISLNKDRIDYHAVCIIAHLHPDDRDGRICCILAVDIR